MNKNQLDCQQQYEYDKVNEWGRNENLKQRAKALYYKYIRQNYRPSAVELVGDC